MPEMKEVRWHGRGGQGAKTASYILAVGAAEEGWNVQAFPEYGAERRGAPLRSYVRISDEPIRLRESVKQPNVVVVLDDSLLTSENVAEGVEEDGIVLVNTSMSPDEVRQRLQRDDIRVATVDATQIALDTIGRNIPNAPMLGALAKMSDVITVENAKVAVDNQLGEKLPPNLIEANCDAIQRANEEVST